MGVRCSYRSLQTNEPHPWLPQACSASQLADWLPLVHSQATEVIWPLNAIATGMQRNHPVIDWLRHTASGVLPCDAVSGCAQAPLLGGGAGPSGGAREQAVRCADRSESAGDARRRPSGGRLSNGRIAGGQLTGAAPHRRPTNSTSALDSGVPCMCMEGLRCDPMCGGWALL